MTHHHRATATAVDRYPVVRTCLLVGLLATAIALAFRPGTAMVIVAAAVFACVLLGAGERIPPRARQPSAAAEDGLDVRPLPAAVPVVTMDPW